MKFQPLAPTKNEQDAASSKQTLTNRKFIGLGIACLLLLVVLCYHSAVGTTKKNNYVAGMSDVVVETQDQVTCANQIQLLLTKNVGNADALLASLPVAEDFQYVFDEETDEKSYETVRLTKDELADKLRGDPNILSTFSKPNILYVGSRRHPAGLCVYPDNSVVQVLTKPCRVQAVYMSREDGNVQGDIAQHVQICAVGDVQRGGWHNSRRKRQNHGPGMKGKGYGGKGNGRQNSLMKGKENGRRHMSKSADHGYNQGKGKRSGRQGRGRNGGPPNVAEIIKEIRDFQIIKCEA